MEFETRNMMDNAEFEELMANIRAEFITGKEHAQECEITAYIPILGEYVTQRGYMADCKPQMYLADETHIVYDSCRLAFIGGVSSAGD